MQSTAPGDDFTVSGAPTAPKQPRRKHADGHCMGTSDEAVARGHWPAHMMPTEPKMDDPKTWPQCGD